MLKVLQRHEILGISEREYLALLEVRKLLDSMEQENFCMSVTAYRGDYCNTVACIGGHVGLIMHDGDERLAQAYVNKSIFSPLGSLYYPGSQWSVDESVESKHWAWEAVPKHAAVAIDRFVAGLLPWADDQASHVAPRPTAVR